METPRGRKRIVPNWVFVVLVVGWLLVVGEVDSWWLVRFTLTFTATSLTVHAIHGGQFTCGGAPRESDSQVIPAPVSDT